MSARESKHTPGPWELRRIGGDPTNRYEGIFGADGSKICTFVRDTGHRSAARNGTLLAAAPEMLEALRGLLALAEYTHTCQEPCEQCRAVQAAHAAIAKAEGREP